MTIKALDHIKRYLLSVIFLLALSYVPSYAETVPRTFDYSGNLVLDYQRALNLIGFNSGPEDGILGPKTRRAIRLASEFFPIESAPSQAGLSLLVDTVIENKYSELPGDVSNPDRGFYIQKHSRDGEAAVQFDHPFSPPPVLTSARMAGATETVYRVYFEIDGFQKRDLTPQILEDFRDILTTARNLGLTIIPRWTYHFPTRSETAEGSSADHTNHGAARTASVEQMIRHIEQLSPIINEYTDAISFIEAGFIGFWGEWHGDQYGNSDHWHPARKELITAWLQSTSEDVFIALRYPSDLKRMQDISGYERLGLHHDCPNYRYDLYPRYGIVAKNAPQGGEVCEYRPKTDYNCSTMIPYFERFQFDVLNSSNWSGAISRFLRQGCLTEIRNRLGYRFVIRASKYENGTITFAVENTGFGKSFKSRLMSIRVDDRVIKTEVDVKDWKPGTLSIVSVHIGDAQTEAVEIVIQDGIIFANTTGNQLFLQDM